MLAYALRDDSGQAARLVAAVEAGAGLGAAAEMLLAELVAWSAAPGGAMTPLDWVLSRWNDQGDSHYRGYVNLLLDRDIPAGTDFVKAVDDCRVRLGLADRPAGR